MVQDDSTALLGPPLKKQGLQGVVYERLRKAILEGRIEPGNQIKIGDLAARLNVSANPIREALRQLEAEGMVSFLPNRRIMVNKLSRKDLYDIYSLLIPMEKIALEKCFSALDTSVLKALSIYCEKMSHADINGPQWIEFNNSFHRTIHELSGSPRLQKITRSLRANVAPYFYLVVRDRSRINQANNEHAFLLQALEERDRNKAYKVMRKHLQNGCKAIDKILPD